MTNLKHLVVLLTLSNHWECSDISNSVCHRESCESDYTGDIDWEQDDVSKQLRSWLAQQRSKNKLVFCRHEKEERPLGEGAVPLYKYRRCDFMDYWTEYSYEGKKDGENKFKGPGKLTFKTADTESNYNRGGRGHSHTNRIADRNEFCIIDNAFMSLFSIQGKFKQGLSSGEIRIVQNNNAETSGQAV